MIESKASPKESQAPERLASAGRRIAVLGGTTSLGDCHAALGYLADPDRLVRGPAIAEFERTFARQVGVAHAFSFRHGRVGLYGILRALGIGAGDEVLLQVPTHVVVPSAVRYVGARPVYVDCRPDSYNMDLEQAKRKITSRTKALILQHTFGIPADLDAALELARAHGIELVEDCVHALGSTYRGQPVGSFARVAFFSTEETKTISTTAGGLAVTRDAALAERLRAFQASCAWPSRQLVARYLVKLIVYHLATEPRLHVYTRQAYEALGRRNPLPGAMASEEFVGEQPPDYLTRLSNAQAAVGLRQLRRLDANVAHRRAIAAIYRSRLTSLGKQVPHPPAGADPAYLRFPVRVHQRERALRVAAPRAVLGTWFTSPLEEASAFEAVGYSAGSCPEAEAAARCLVNLSTHPRIASADAEAIVTALAEEAL